MPMKATKLLLAAALFTSLATLSFAGPGPDYWARLTQAAKDNAKADVQAKVQAAPQVAVCATCSCPAMKKA